MDCRCLEPVFFLSARFANGFPQTAAESQQERFQAEGTELARTRRQAMLLSSDAQVRRTKGLFLPLLTYMSQKVVLQLRLRWHSRFDI